jgi:flagellar hook-associated protein 3 FlgL
MSVASFSRLGTANTYDNTLANLQSRQNKLSSLQEQLTSGKRVTNPSDDPTAAAQAERALNRLARISTDQRALESQRNAISQAEGTLADVTEALQRVRDLAVNAGNGSFNAAERKTVAQEITGLRDRILSLANSQDANGQPLFSALGSALKPFVGPAVSPDYAFNGLAGTAVTDTYAIPSTLDGESAFMLQATRDVAYTVLPSDSGSNLRTGAVLRDPNAGAVNGSSYSLEIVGASGGTVTYNLTEIPANGGPNIVSNGLTAPWSQTDGFNVAGMAGLSLNVKGLPTVIGANDTISISPNTSVFATVDKLVDGITNATSTAQANQAVTQALHNIDISLSRIASVRGQAGDLLNRADSINASNDKRNIEQEGNRSRAEDMDMVKGVSQFQNQQTGYQAALQSYAQIQKLSLFNFIG